MCMPMHKQDIQSLPVVAKGDGYSICVYRSKPLKPFLLQLEPMTLRKRIRFFFEVMAGFTVYYLLCDGVCAGNTAVVRGGTGRYRFCTASDIVVGPTFIQEAFRGRKLSTLLLRETIKLQKGTYEYAYGYVHKDNAASLAMCKTIGLAYYRNAKITPIARHVVESPHGDYVLLRKHNES